MKRLLFTVLALGMRNRRIFGRSTWWLWFVVPVPFCLYAFVFDHWRAYIWWPKAIEQLQHLRHVVKR